MVDKNKIKQSVEMFLEAIGEDPTRDGLVDTPDRVARMCDELFAGIGNDAKEHLSKVFDAESRGLIVEKDIQFYSMCEHHLLPFFGKVHIAYEHGDKVVGISKLARTVEVYARRPQIQENMTSQIAQAIMDELKPYGVLVVVEAEHMCMSMRGVKNASARTVTMATLGSFNDNEKLKEEALRLIRF